MARYLKLSGGEQSPAFGFPELVDQALGGEAHAKAALVRDCSLAGCRNFQPGGWLQSRGCRRGWRDRACLAAG